MRDRVEYCKWEEEDADDSMWETDCGRTFVLNEGSPSENEMKFCCYCGRPLEEVRHEI